VFLGFTDGIGSCSALGKLQYELYDIKNNSLMCDPGILLQTAAVMLLGKGAC